MCGRYSFTHSKERIEKRFNAKISSDWKPHYNIAPTQNAPVITNKNSGEVFLFRWGLVPSWSLNENTGHNLINAKGETVLTRAPFKQLIQSHRCLILADGFFEWKTLGKKRIPHRFTLNTDEAFAFAGIWDSWDSGDDVLNTFTIITTQANLIVSEVSDRMPVILPADLEMEWLRDDLSEKEILQILQPFDSKKMSSYPAHRAVNSPSTNSPECIQMAPKIYPGETLSLFD